MLGFGYTKCAPDIALTPDTWVQSLVCLLDALNIDRVSVVGNSFGGAIALALAKACPQRVNRLVLMGAAGINAPISDGLEKVWGYTPSLEAMKGLMEVFAYDHSIITEDLVRMRYEASIRADVQERFARLFPAPRQNGVEMLALTEVDLMSITNKTLLIHGLNDQVIPVEWSERMLRLLPHAELHTYGECGHWVQIERAAQFSQLVSDFLINN